MLRADFTLVAVPSESRELFAGCWAEQAFERPSRRLGEVTYGENSLGVKLRFCDWADSPHHTNREGMQEFELV